MQLSFETHLKNFDRKYEISYAEAKDDAFTQVKSLLIEQLEKENAKNSDHAEKVDL